MRLPLARGSKLFLGLAHFTSRPAGNTILARSYHLFYVFAARPPFELVGLGRPFTLPSELRLTQVATGMLLRDETTLILSYSEHECEPRLAALPLQDVLADLELSD